MLGMRGQRFNRTSWFAGVCTVGEPQEAMSAAPMAPHGTGLAAEEHADPLHMLCK